MSSPGNNRYRFVIAVLVIMVRTCVGLIWASAGPLLPLFMQEFGISRGTVSWYVSAVSLIMATVAVPVGILGMKTAGKKLFALGALLQSASILALFVTSFPLLLLTRVLFGFGIAMNAPIAASIFAEWFNSRELPLVNGIAMAFVSLANAVAFVTTIPLANALSWRMALTIYGIIALACALAWVIWGKDRQKAAPAAPFKHQEAPVNIAGALRRRTSILLAVSLIGPFCLATALSFWLPTYYHQVFGMPLETASSITGIITVTGAAASLIGGILPMRLGLRRPFLLIPGLLTGLLATGCFLFDSFPVILVSLALFGVVSCLSTASIFTIPMELPGITPRTGAIILALALGAGNLGNFLGPITVGYLADLTGSYLPGLIICCVLSLSMFAGGIFLPETGPRARQAAVKKVLEGDMP